MSVQVTKTCDGCGKKSSDHRGYWYRVQSEGEADWDGIDVDLCSFKCLREWAGKDHHRSVHEPKPAEGAK